MDVAVEERALAPVGEEPVDGGNPGGVEIVGMLEHRRDLEQLVSHGSDPIHEYDRSSRFG